MPSVIGLLFSLSGTTFVPALVEVSLSVVLAPLSVFVELLLSVEVELLVSLLVSVSVVVELLLLVFPLSEVFSEFVPEEGTVVFLIAVLWTGGKSHLHLCKFLSRTERWV